MKTITDYSKVRTIYRTAKWAANEVPQHCATNSIGFFVELVLETRWEPDFWDMGQVMKNYEGLSFEGFAEESGNEIYINTDSDGEFFKDRYVVAVHAPGKYEYERNYFAEGQEYEICEIVEEITEGKISPSYISEINREEIDALVKQMYGKDAYFIFKEFDYEF